MRSGAGRETGRVCDDGEKTFSFAREMSGDVSAFGFVAAGVCGGGGMAGGGFVSVFLFQYERRGAGADADVWGGCGAGALLTFLVFNPHKRLREIVSDCLIIGAVQAGALVYGLYTVYQEHPKLTVLYEYGTATALTHREVSAEPEWAALPDSAAHSSRVAGVAWTVFSQPHGKNTYQPPAKAAAVLAKADAAARRAMSPEEQAQLAQWEQSHGQVYVFAVIGKYTGAYVVLDRRFHYLTKIGEKEAGL